MNHTQTLSQNHHKQEYLINKRKNNSYYCKSIKEAR
jgi:hypothetical protein